MGQKFMLGVVSLVTTVLGVASLASNALTYPFDLALELDPKFNAPYIACACGLRVVFHGLMLEDACFEFNTKSCIPCV